MKEVILFIVSFLLVIMSVILVGSAAGSGVLQKEPVTSYGKIEYVKPAIWPRVVCLIGSFGFLIYCSYHMYLRAIAPG